MKPHLDAQIQQKAQAIIRERLGALEMQNALLATANEVLTQEVARLEAELAKAKGPTK